MRFAKMYEMLLLEKDRIESKLKGLFETNFLRVILKLIWFPTTIPAKHDEADETVARITEENKKLIEELQIKEQLLHNIKSKLFRNSKTFFFV